MSENQKKAVVGGTFETLHKGHRVLLKKAFELGQVFVGLTSDEMAERERKRKVRNFNVRKKGLEDFFKKEFSSVQVSEANVARKMKANPKGQTSSPVPIIVKIEDKFGPALKEDFDYIVVSPETYETAVQLNEERKKIGKKPLQIVKVDLVLAEDGKPISDTRISKGEIDEEGNLADKSSS